MTSLWLKRGVWVGSGRVISAALTFGQNVLITRLLSPSEAGLYFLILSFSWGASLFSQWGSSTEVVRQTSEALALDQPDLAKVLARRLFVQTLWRSVGLGFLLALVPAMAYRFFFSVDFSGSVRVLIGTLTLITTLQALVPEVFRGFHQIEGATIFSGPLPNFFGFVFLGFLYLAHGESSLFNVTAVIVAGAGVSLMLGFYFVRKLLQTRSGVQTPQPEAKNSELSLNTRAIAVAQISAFVLNQADFLCLGGAVSKDQMALYAAAQRLTLILLMPMAIVGSILIAKIAELWTKRRQQGLQDVMSAGAMLAFAPALGLWLVYLFAGRWLLTHIFGPFYAQGYSVLIVLGSIQIFHIAAGLSGYALLMAGQQKAMMRISASSALLSLILSYILSRQFGLMGAATGSGVGVVVLTIWMSVESQTRLKLKSWVDVRAFLRISKGWVGERSSFNRRPGV